MKTFIINCEHHFEVIHLSLAVHGKTHLDIFLRCKSIPQHNSWNPYWVDTPHHYNLKYLFVFINMVYWKYYVGAMLTIQISNWTKRQNSNHQHQQTKHRNNDIVSVFSDIVTSEHRGKIQTIEYVCLWLTCVCSMYKKACGRGFALHKASAVYIATK